MGMVCEGDEVIYDGGVVVHVGQHALVARLLAEDQIEIEFPSNERLITTVGDVIPVNRHTVLFPSLPEVEEDERPTLDERPTDVDPPR